MNALFLHHHLGLGDHIICNGLVRYLSNRNKIKLFCKHRNYNNVQIMYEDNSNIELISIYNDQEAENIGTKEKHYIKLGVGLNPVSPPNMGWDEIFYEQAGIPYDLSWSNFKINRPDTQIDFPNYDYSVVSNQDSNNIDRIDYNQVSYPKIFTNRGGFFDNLDLILHAKEIHCINSAYLHLVDRLDINNTQLFYHKNFNPNIHSNFRLIKNWKIV